MEVILVNEQDEPIGTMEKIEAHEKALLHRAFSVFIFNDKGDLLLQKRAAAKYHSPGLWTNTCCSHPRPGFELEAEAKQRLQEEMGFTTDIEKAFDFIYKAPFDNGLTEYEFDHVFIGRYQGDVVPNPAEVSDYCYKPVPDILQSMQDQPHLYTAWFLIALPRLAEYLANHASHRRA